MPWAEAIEGVSAALSEATATSARVILRNIVSLLPCVVVLCTVQVSIGRHLHGYGSQDFSERLFRQSFEGAVIFIEPVSALQLDRSRRKCAGALRKILLTRPKQRCRLPPKANIGHP